MGALYGGIYKKGDTNIRVSTLQAQLFLERLEKERVEKSVWL